MGLLSFVLRRAAREASSSKQRSLLVVFCVAVGISAIVSVQVYTDSVTRYFTTNVREITGGDITLTMHGEWSPEQYRYLEEGRESGRFDYTKTEQTQGTVAVHGVGPNSVFSSIKVVDPDRYPFYGTIETGSGADGGAILSEGKALINKVGVDTLDLQIGDEVRVNGAPFIFGDLLVRDPTSDPMGSQIIATVLVQRDERYDTVFRSGSMSVYLISIADEGDLNDLAAEMSEVYGERAVMTYVEISEEVESASDRMGSALLVVGLSSLLLGGLGVSSTANMMVRQRLKDMAVIKCFGGRSIHLIAIFVVQILMLALLGVAIGTISGVALSTVIPTVLEDLVALRPSIFVDYAMVIRVAILGLLVASVFSVIPVLGVSRIRPLHALRQEGELPSFKRIKENLRNVGYALLVAGVFGAALSSMVGSYKIGFAVSYGALAFIAVLYVVVLLILSLILRILALRSPSGKLAVRNLRRQKGKAVSSILAISIGVGAIAVISLLQQTVVQSLRDEIEGGRTYNVIVIGMRGEAMARLSDYLDTADYVEEHAVTRSVMGMLESVNGEPLEAEGGRPAPLFLTEASRGLDGHHARQLVEGRSVDPETPGEAVLMEDDAELYGVSVGDTATLRIGLSTLDVSVVGIQSSERSGPVMMGFSGTLISPSTLDPIADRTPQISGQVLVKTVPERTGGEAVADIQSNFPEATMVLDIGSLMEIVYRVLNTMTRFMQFLGLFSVAAGGVLLAGMMVLSKYERRRDMAVVRCLGGSSKTVLGTYVIESGLVGLMAGLLGFLSASGAVAIVVRLTMETGFQFQYPFFGLTVLACTLFAVIVGMGSVVDVIYEKPLNVLKYE